MRKISINVLFVFIFFSFLIIVGCDDTITNSDIDRKIIPDMNVSYKEHISPVLRVKCASSGCHNSTDRGDASNYSVDTWVEATNFSYVISFDPENSPLVWAIEGNSTYPMPPQGYPRLTENQIEGIKTWIREGAFDN